MKLPVVSGNDAVKTLKKLGFAVTRQKGSHVSMHKTNPDGIILVVIPMRESVKKGTLLSILKQARVEREEFISALNR